MDYCMEHPEELSKVAGLQKKVDEVKNVMVDNIEQVWQSVEKSQRLLPHSWVNERKKYPRNCLTWQEVEGY